MIAPWDNTNQQWTPEGSIRAGDDGTYEELVIDGGSNVSGGASLITGDGKKVPI